MLNSVYTITTLVIDYYFMYYNLYQSFSHLYHCMKNRDCVLHYVYTLHTIMHP